MESIGTLVKKEMDRIESKRRDQQKEVKDENLIEDSPPADDWRNQY